MKRLLNALILVLVLSTTTLLPAHAQSSSCIQSWTIVLNSPGNPTAQNEGINGVLASCVVPYSGGNISPPPLSQGQALLTPWGQIPSSPGGYWVDEMTPLDSAFCYSLPPTLDAGTYVNGGPCPLTSASIPTLRSWVSYIETSWDSYCETTLAPLYYPNNNHFDRCPGP